ncbi:MAG: hypothetical protein GF364_11160 [Candidatus Lokiarchaeota archaeon]|nr:hypothetical protein [Candidatus Lokiarchaeota archaeon]
MKPNKGESQESPKITHRQKSRGLAEEICIWQDSEQCGDCELKDHVFCKPKPKYTIYFASPMIIVMVAVIWGIMDSVFDFGAKIAVLAIWFGYMFVFLNFWESYMLCNHCPYYANEQEKVLHCPIDRGKLKTGRYDPGPLSNSEKVEFIIGVLILILFPLPFLLIAGQIIQLISAIIGIMLWLLFLQTMICTDCINFSCPLNKVPDEIRNKFIQKNPIIKKAWEEKGYQID